MLENKDKNRVSQSFMLGLLSSSRAPYSSSCPWGGGC